MQFGSFLASLISISTNFMLGLALLIPTGDNTYGSHPVLGMIFLLLGTLSLITLADEL